MGTPALITTRLIQKYSKDSYFAITGDDTQVGNLLENKFQYGLTVADFKIRLRNRHRDLCSSEKTIIAMAERSSFFSRRPEIVSTCRHRTKFRYHMVRKVKKRKGLCKLSIIYI